MNSESGKTFSTINPSTGEVITNIQEGDKVRKQYHFRILDVLSNDSMAGDLITISANNRIFSTAVSISFPVNLTLLQRSSSPPGNAAHLQWEMYPSRQRHLVEGGSTTSLVCHKYTTQRLEMSQ